MFRGKVAIVTGSGNGLGFAYAKALASQGCKVVINDIGLESPHGGGDADHQKVVIPSSSSVANRAANELNALYGKGTAVANETPVCYDRAGEILECAMKHFGRIDLLVNNAGIVRDKVFEKTSETDWNMLLQVHLSGVFRLSQLVYAQLQQQYKTNQKKKNSRQGSNQGKILFVSSVAVYGSFGQTAYGAMKSALIGLCASLSREIQMRKYPFHVHTIMPLADSRILRTSHLPQDVYAMLSVDSILPLFLHVCSDSCLMKQPYDGGDGGSGDSGDAVVAATVPCDVFEMAGGQLFRVQLQRTSQPIATVDANNQVIMVGNRSVGADGGGANTTTTTPSSSSLQSFDCSDDAVAHLIQSITQQQQQQQSRQRTSPPVLKHIAATSSGNNSSSQQQKGSTTTSTMSSTTNNSNNNNNNNNNNTTTTTDSNNTSELASLFQLIQLNLNDMAKSDQVRINNTFLYKLSDDKKYLLDMGHFTLKQLTSSDDDDEKNSEAADVTITMKDEDFMNLMSGKSQPAQMFFAKKLKVDGNLQLAMKMMTMREKLTAPRKDALSSKL